MAMFYRGYDGYQAQRHRAAIGWFDRPVGSIRHAEASPNPDKPEPSKVSPAVEKPLSHEQGGMHPLLFIPPPMHRRY